MVIVAVDWGRTRPNPVSDKCIYKKFVQITTAAVDHIRLS